MYPAVKQAAVDLYPAVKQAAVDMYPAAKQAAVDMYLSVRDSLKESSKMLTLRPVPLPIPTLNLTIWAEEAAVVVVALTSRFVTR